MTEGETFDLIVSNPPVHLGLQPEFTVLSSLVAGCKERLNPGRVLHVSLFHSLVRLKRALKMRYINHVVVTVHAAVSHCARERRAF